MRKFKHEYFLKTVAEKELHFYQGDAVTIKTTNGGGRTGVIERIGPRGIYLDVGNKNAIFFNYEKIDEIRK